MERPPALVMQCITWFTPASRPIHIHNPGGQVGGVDLHSAVNLSDSPKSTLVF